MKWTARRNHFRNYRGPTRAPHTTHLLHLNRALAAAGAGPVSTLSDLHWGGHSLLRRKDISMLEHLDICLLLNVLVAYKNFCRNDLLGEGFISDAWRILENHKRRLVQKTFFKDKQNRTRPVVWHASFMTNALPFIWSALCTFLRMFLNEKLRRYHS